MWNGGSGVWETPGSGDVATDYLTSPELTVTSPGGVFVTVTHRYNFENAPGSIEGYDGGQFQYSADGGANWHTIPQNLINGATYNSTIDPGFRSEIENQRAFSGQSSGWATMAYAVSLAALGTGESPYVEGTTAVFDVGDTIRFRFLAAWDLSARQTSPNWAIASVTFTMAEVVPEPSAALLALGAAGLAWAGRRRRGFL